MINSEVHYNYGPLQLSCHRNPQHMALSVGPRRPAASRPGSHSRGPTFLPTYLAWISVVLRESLGGDDQRPRESSEPGPLKAEPSGQRERLSLRLDPHLPSCSWGDMVLQGLGPSCCAPGHSDGHQENGRGRGLGPMRICGTPGKAVQLSELGFCLKWGGGYPPPQSVQRTKRADTWPVASPGLDECQLRPTSWLSGHSGWRRGGALCSLPLTLALGLNTP